MAKRGKTQAPKKPMWTGRITIGLVNVPVKLYRMVFDSEFSFRFLHKVDGQPLRYDRVCIKEEKVVPWKDVVKGYEASKGEFVVFENEELKAARPESDQRIRVDRFVDYLSADPVFFETSYILAPDESDEAYSLLLTALQRKGKAGVGRITLRTKEYPVLIHPYNGALILTTLKHADEVMDPSGLEELSSLKEPSEEELDLAMKIVADLSGGFNIKDYNDTYKEKINELIDKKLKGERIVIEKPAKEEAKELMVALQETLKKLKMR